MRDIEVPPIVFVGCIGPTFLCMLTVGLIYIYVNLPLWTNGPELQAALERYEYIRAAVFQGKESPDALTEVAVEPFLLDLQWDLREQRYTSYYSNQEPIVVTEIREYTDDCSVVISEYRGSKHAAFILHKTNSTWKVQFTTPDWRAGIAGTLPFGGAC